MPNTVKVERAGTKQVVRVGLESVSLTITPARKSGFDYVSVTLDGQRPAAAFVEVFSTGVGIRLVNLGDRQRSAKYEYCIPVPPGSPGPTFPGPVCPSNWPFPGWPIPTRPGTDDLFVVRVAGRGFSTRAASIANSEQLLKFIRQSSPEVGKAVGNQTAKGLDGLSLFNNAVARDALFRRQLKEGLRQVGPPGSAVFSEKKSKSDKVGDVANAACAAAGASGIPIAAAAACGFALGFAIGRLIWD